MINIKDMIKDFFSVKFNIYLIIILLLLGLSIFFAGVGEEKPIIDEEEFAVNYFYLPTCPHCKEQRPIVEALEQEMPEIPFYYHDASSSSGSALLYKLAMEAGLDTSDLGVPITFTGKTGDRTPFVGVHEKEELREGILECKLACEMEQEPTEEVSQDIESGFSDFELPFLGRTDLTKYSLPGLAIILGLIDGFNPCAMWVLVYLIGLLLEVKDKRRVWLIVGSFLIASGTLYFLFMTAWLNVFLLAGYIRILTILIGLVALGGGIISIKEFIETKGAPVCKIGDMESKSKTMQKAKFIVNAPLTIGILLSIIALAFVVNSVEFVCSSAIPAVFTQVLTLSGLSTLTYYLYIGLYTLFFMLDDLVIFGLAAFAVNSDFGQKYANYAHALGGVIMLGLGLMLLFAPHWLG